MRKIIVFFFYIIFLPSFLYCSEAEKLFSPSPRLEYLKKELQKRLSIHKLISHTPEKISNPVLFREGIIYSLYELEIEKAKFFILKEISDKLANLKRKEKEIDLLQKILGTFRQISLNPEITPQLSLWLSQEGKKIEKEIENRKKEKDFYFNFLENEFNISNEEKVNELFGNIKQKFEKEIIDKRRKLLDWDWHYFQERKEQYSHLVYYLIIPTNLPYLFFSFPIPKTILEELYNLIYERNKSEIEILDLENHIREEAINIQLYYIQKRKAILKEILEKIEKIRKTPIEELSALEFLEFEKIYLETKLSLIEQEEKEEILKRELLRFNLSTSKEPKVLFSYPLFDKLLKLSEEDSPVLKRIEKDLLILRKMAQFSRQNQKYFLSLAKWVEFLYAKEKEKFFRELFQKWYFLVSSIRSYNLQKEILGLKTLLYNLSLNSPLYTFFDKKLKEIEIIKQNLILLEKEEKIALNWLDLKDKIKTPKLEDIPLKPSVEESNLENLYKKYFPDKHLREKEKEITKELINSELSWLAKGNGKIFYPSKEDLLKGKINLPFRIEIVSEFISLPLKEDIVKLAKEYHSLRERIEKENENKELLYNHKLLEITKRRIQNLKELQAFGEEILKNLEKKISPLVEERIIQQKIKILNLSDEILEKEKLYCLDLISVNLPVTSLQPYQENLLLQKISPIIDRERISLLIPIKRKEQEVLNFDLSHSLNNLEEARRKIEETFSVFNDLLNIFAVKERLGMISTEDLAELNLIKNRIEEESYQFERKILEIKKKGTPSETALRSEFIKELQNLQIDKVIKNNPYLKLLKLEMDKFSPEEKDFLSYLYKERIDNIKKVGRNHVKTLAFYHFLLSSLEEKEKICREELKNIIEDFKEERIGIYGIYGLSSVLSKYLEEQIKNYNAQEEFKKYQREVLDLIGNITQFNLLSLFPDLKLIGKKIFSSLRFEPNFLKERKKRRDEFIIKNYNQKNHALRFLRAEKDKEHFLKERERLFKLAYEKETKTVEFLDNLWEEEKEFREKIRKKISESKIDIKKELLSLRELLPLNEKNEEILELLFINYAQRFRKESKIKDYINDIVKLFSILPLNNEEIKKLPSWWTKYISPLLPYPEKTYLEEIIDPRVLGLYFYYAELKNFLQMEKLFLLSPRIEEDKKFFSLDYTEIPPEEIEAYLKWTSEIRKELDILTLSQYSKKEWEDKIRTFLKNAKGLFGYTYGSLKDKNLQKEIICWLITSGMEEKDYPFFTKIAEKVIEEIKKFFPPPSREEKLSTEAGLRMKWLIYKGEYLLLKEEESRIDEAYFVGNLLSWCEFFWENKIKEEEISHFFSFMKKLKEEPLFINIYGKYEDIEILRKNFYISSLSYWAEKWLNFYRKNPQEAERELKKTLSRFNLIYQLNSFQNLYGPLDIIKINSQKWKEKRRLRAFMSKLGFFTDWSLYLSLDDKEMEIFFEDLYHLFLERKLIEEFYKRQHIELKLDLEIAEEKEEFLGILSNWLQFFHFRGIKGKNEIINALKEIEAIQEKSKSYQLALNIDEIRFWWEKTKIKDWNLEFIERIFYNIYQVKNLIRDSGNEILKEFYSEWEDFPFKEEFLKIIKEKMEYPLSRSEIYNLAEKIMPIYDVNYEELKKYYKEKIYIENFYLFFNKEKISSQKFFQFYSLIKNMGYSLKEMYNFLYMYSLLKNNKIISKTSPSDSEIFGLLNSFLKQVPFDRKNFSLWINKAILLVDSFYKEHSVDIDFSLLKSILNYSLLRMRPWQIRLLVEKGALSKNSPDIEICHLNNIEKELLRYILRITWDNLKEILSEEEINLLLNSSLDKLSIKKIIERYAAFQDGLINTVIQNYYENKKTPQEIFIEQNKIIKEIKKIVFIKLSQFFSTEKEKLLKKREKKFLSLIRKSKEKKLTPHPFSNRKIIQQSLIEKARLLYLTELPPHKSSSLVWKVLEGMNVEDTLKIYLEDYWWVENLYKNVFLKERLDSDDYSIITYFSEEINFGELNKELLVEILNISKEVKESFQKFFDKNISIKEAIDYSWPILYSGGDPEIVKEIFRLANEIYNLIESNKNDNLISELLYHGGNLYNIEIGEKPIYSYSKEEYIKVIKEAINLLQIKETEINYKGLEKVATKTKFLLTAPAAFFRLARKVELLYEFIKKFYKEIPKKEILIYLDFLQKDSINYLSLKEIFLEKIPQVIIVQNVESAFSFAFKNFLKNSLKSDKIL